MTKLELIDRIAQKQSLLSYRDVEFAVKAILDQMAESLTGGDRIEIRGFGSFSLHFQSGRIGRNPKTNVPVSLPAKYVPHFKPGKALRERVSRAYRSTLRMNAQPDSHSGTTPEQTTAAPQSIFEHGLALSRGSSGST